MPVVAKTIRGPFINRDNLKVNQIPDIQVFVTKATMYDEAGFHWIELDPKILNQDLLIRFDEEGWEVEITGQNTYEFIRQYRYHNDRAMQPGYRYKMILPDDTWIRMPDDHLKELLFDYFNSLNLHLTAISTQDQDDSIQAIFNEFEELETPRLPDLKEFYEAFEDFHQCHSRLRDSAKELKALLHKFGVKHELF